MNAMKRLTIRYLAAGLAASSASLLAPLALAQSDTSNPLPEKTLRLVVPYSAGGGTDIIARHVAERLRARLHRTIVVENTFGK